MITIVGLRRSFGFAREPGSGRSHTRRTCSRLARALRERPAALTITLVAAAAMAALLEQAFSLATGGWSWIAFAQGAMKNASFALLLSGVAMLGRADRRQPNTQADTHRPCGRPEPSTDELVRNLSGIADVAEELELVEAAGQGLWDESVDVLDSVRWTLAHYVLRGDRSRRLMNVQDDTDAAGHGSEPCDELSAAACELRARATELASHVRHTNVVMADWLVAHRVAAVNPHYLDSNALYDRYRHGTFDPASIAEDPVYLFVCHLTDVLDSFEHGATPDHTAASHVRAQLTLPLRAMREEVSAAVAYGSAAVDVTRVVAKSRSN
jgi:hypothetical protein